MQNTQVASINFVKNIGRTSKQRDNNYSPQTPHVSVGCD